MSMSNYTARSLLNAFFGKGAPNFGGLSSAPTIYVALSTTEPAGDGSNVTEPSGDGYARVATSGATWNAATDADPSLVDNAAEIAFPAATDDWLSGDDFEYVALYDAATSGNFLGAGVLTVPKNALAGDTLKLPIGSAVISLT